MPSNYDTEHVKFHNLDVVIANLRSLGGGAGKYIEDVLDRCLTLDIWPRWISHISLTDHSLEDLRELGHPYSTRFDVDSFVHPDSEVHKQSGSLVEGSHIERSATADGASVKISNTSPHYIFLRYGTRNMRMRDPAGATMKDALPDVQRRLHEEIRGAIISLMTS
jgi:hypothetical protein